ncbi:MAG: GNAT family N-acetyltransferase [Lysobacterales bacterium]|nr:MAG: GNAT family N-acetyltransferase [Xanthomonadales bacterium]
MLIRTHRNGDIPDISRLYYDTIHRINSNDYTLEQIDAWAPVVPDVSFWKKRAKKYRVYVAEENERIVGFTELDSAGHIDCFFVHHEWQRRGVGSRLMERVVATANRELMPRLFAEVSVTAAPFFSSRGFVVVRENKAIRRNVTLKQYAMERWLTA